MVTRNDNTLSAGRWLTACVVALLVMGVILAGRLEAETAPAALKRLTEEASRDLRRIRRKSLRETPTVEVVSREEFVEEYVVKTLDFVWGGDHERPLAVFKALGMLPADLRAKPFLRRYGAVMAAAAYDFLGKRILFPGTRVRRDVLLHELVHAMQDQHHDLRKLMLTTNFEFDRVLAMGALIEGEATNVQLRYSMGRSRALAGVTPYGTLRKQVRAYCETIKQHVMRRLPDVPPNLIRAQAFVYDEGVLFVERLRRRKRNWAWVNAAYAMPPRSTTQILHPEKYVAGEWPIELTIDNKEKLLPGHSLVAENTLGEFGMRLFLTTHLPGLEAADGAVKGWRGDRVFLYRKEGSPRPTLVWISTWENAGKAERMRGYLYKALVNCVLGVGWYDVKVPTTAGAAVRVRRNFTDLIAVIDTEAGSRRLRRPSITKSTTQGRPFGDKEEKTKGQ